MTARRIEVEIEKLIVEDPALARPGEVAAAIERELARLGSSDGPVGASTRPSLSASLGRDRSADALGAAVGRAVGEELAR